MRKLTALLLSGSLGLSVCAETALVERGGILRFESAGVAFTPQLFAPSWSGLSLTGGWSAEADGSMAFALKEGDRTVIEGRARFTSEGKGIQARWTFDVKADYESNGLCIGIDLPCGGYADGEMTFDGAAVALPHALGERPWLGGASTRRIDVKGPRATDWSLRLTEAPYYAMVQDNRQWNGEIFSARIHVGGKSLREGERREVVFTLDTADGFILADAAPLTIEAGGNWIPVRDSLDIQPGSALDFSCLADAPAGKYGRVIAVGDHFEFEGRPGITCRFYGVNLCFDANFLDEKTADELCARLVRSGYNALRIHHYEGTLCDPKDGTAIRPEAMAKLDGLLNACIRHGIYLTTDLFVSRPVPWRSCGIDRDGTVPMDEYKQLIQFHAGARENYRLFTRNFLSHRNPETGRTWAEEPALAFLALVNEGNLGNIGYTLFRDSPEVRALYAGEIPANPWENGEANAAFTLFLADREIDFMSGMRDFLVNELGCRALLTDMSAWRNPVTYQLCRRTFDYVDDHFYVDHPQFLEQPWRLPSKCVNANPVRGGNAGFEGVVRHRIRSKPFTITEFNYSGPGKFRGVGGMMLGAQAALQDYDGIWRFAWSHSRASVLDGGRLTYFDGASDPLQRATERAVITLFRRGDLAPLSRRFTFALPEDRLRGDFSVGPHLDFPHLWFGWYRQLATEIADDAAPGEGGVYPAVYREGAETFERLVADEKPGDGQIVLDRSTGLFGVKTPRTVGAFAESGDGVIGPLKFSITGSPAAVWVSALDDRPIVSSRRLLLTHVTDVQDTGMMYADQARSVLLGWGGLPHLMAAGRAEISLAIKGRRPKVHALAADGSRREEVPSSYRKGRLVFTADIARDPDSATWLYEIETKE